LPFAVAGPFSENAPLIFQCCQQAGDRYDPGKLTPYRGLDEVLVDYAHTSRAVLGDNFVGLYLLRSLATGDFDLTSDVDFVIVTNSELSRGEVELIQSGHMKLIARDSRRVKHLEYSIFPLQKLSEKSSPYGPDGRDDSAARQLWYFVNGGSTIERSDHDNTFVTRWTLRYRSKALFGPEPAAFAPDVTADELRQEIKNSMLGWEKLFIPDSPHNKVIERSSSAGRSAIRDFSASCRVSPSR
jgi:predicted nucleotidyltransferase